jgi:hypothetical protein
MSDIESYLQHLRSHLTDIDAKRADEIIAEARTHIECRQAKLEASGMVRRDAVAEAVHTFGDAELVAERLRNANTGHQHVGPFRLLIAVHLGLVGSLLATHLLLGQLPLPFDIGGPGADSTPWFQVLAFGAIAGPAALLGGWAAGRWWWWLPALPVGILGFMGSALGPGRGEITAEAFLVSGSTVAVAAACAFGGARIRLRSVAGTVCVALTLAFLLLLDRFDSNSSLLAGLPILILLHLWWRWRSARVRKPVLEVDRV